LRITRPPCMGTHRNMPYVTRVTSSYMTPSESVSCAISGLGQEGKLMRRVWDGRRDISQHSEASPRCRKPENSYSIIIPIGCISASKSVFLFSSFLNNVKASKPQKSATHLDLFVCGMYCQSGLRVGQVRAAHWNIHQGLVK
jgi:hypothetical protein